MVTHGGINGSEDSLWDSHVSCAINTINGGDILPADVGCAESGDLLKRNHIQNLKLRLCEITSPSAPSGICMADGFGLAGFNMQDLVNCSLLSVDTFPLVLGREELLHAAVNKAGRLGAAVLQTSNIYLERLGDPRYRLLWDYLLAYHFLSAITFAKYWSHVSLF